MRPVYYGCIRSFLQTGAGHKAYTTGLKFNAVILTEDMDINELQYGIARSEELEKHKVVSFIARGSISTFAEYANVRNKKRKLKNIP